MSQLDLPPISFARYLELLKRRRWQVIPMSLLGLLVGAVVAFFIPRYYVAKTMVVYSGPVLGQVAGAESDPIYTRVRGANLSVLESIPNTLEAMQWIGTSVDDPARQATIEKVQERTTVTSYQVDRESSDYAVVIEYKDPDGGRAAEFANRLRRTWTEELLGQFKQAADLEMRRAMGEVTRHSLARDEATLEINNFRRENGIEKAEDDVGEAGVTSFIKNDLRAEDQIIAGVEGELEVLRTEVEQLERSIKDGFVKPTISKQVPLSADPALSELVNKLLAGIAYNRAAERNWQADPTMSRTYRIRAEELERQLIAIAPQGVTAGMRTEESENPVYAETLKDINQKRAQINARERQLAVHKRRASELRAELASLPRIWREYEQRQQRLGDIESTLADAKQRAFDMQSRLNRALTGNPFTRVNAATVPPAPTDPNVTLVALAGSVLGLGAAIGLVLLLDVLRSTFKTVDDVSYALKLPVLGVMSHLETEEVRTRSVRQRQIVVTVVSLFLVLVLSIVTIYYVAPTRLPPSVLQILDSLLGAETAR